MHSRMKHALVLFLGFPTIVAGTVILFDNDISPVAKQKKEALNVLLKDTSRETSGYVCWRYPNRENPYGERVCGLATLANNGTGEDPRKADKATIHLLGIVEGREVSKESVPVRKANVGSETIWISMLPKNEKQ